MYFSDRISSYRHAIDNCRYICPNECGRHYKRKNHLLDHLRFECGVNPQFKCLYCEKTYRRKSCLKVHIICVHKVLLDDKTI